MGLIKSCRKATGEKATHEPALGVHIQQSPAATSSSSYHGSSSYHSSIPCFGFSPSVPVLLSPHRRSPRAFSSHGNLTRNIPFLPSFSSFLQLVAGRCFVLLLCSRSRRYCTSARQGNNALLGKWLIPVSLGGSIIPSSIPACPSSCWDPARLQRCLFPTSLRWQVSHQHFSIAKGSQERTLGTLWRHGASAPLG